MLQLKDTEKQRAFGPLDRRKADGLGVKAQWGFPNGSKAGRRNEKECGEREAAKRLRNRYHV